MLDSSSFLGELCILELSVLLASFDGDSMTSSVRDSSEEDVCRSGRFPVNIFGLFSKKVCSMSGVKWLDDKMDSMRAKSDSLSCNQQIKT